MAQIPEGFPGNTSGVPLPPGAPPASSNASLPTSPKPIPEPIMNNLGNESTPVNSGAGSNTPTGEPSRPGGAPVRAYMNERIVPYLLEGMKTVAKDQPQNPLKVLGEYLIQKSNEIEGGSSGEKKTPE